MSQSDRDAYDYENNRQQQAWCNAVRRNIAVQASQMPRWLLEDMYLDSVMHALEQKEKIDRLEGKADDR